MIFAVAENSVPEWLAEGAHVVHARSGPGQVSWVRRESDGVWVCVAPPGSGPIVGYRLADALRDLRPRRPDEMSEEELEQVDWESASFHPLTDNDPALAVGTTDLADRVHHVGSLRSECGATTQPHSQRRLPRAP
jgi:hypothetical protein